MITVPYNIEFRPYQLDALAALDAGKRKAVLLWCRRAGKDFVSWNYMIKKAWEEPGNYFYFLLTSKQARKVIWEGRTFEGRRFLDFIPKEILAKEPATGAMQVEFINGSIINVLGIEGVSSEKQIDRFRGITPKGIVFSEYAMLKDDGAWKALQPAIETHKAWVIIQSTPKGKNHYYNLVDGIRHSKNWHFSEIHVDTVFPDNWKDIIEAARESAFSEEFINQEYFCSFSEAASGYYYISYVEKARSGTPRRIGIFPYDKKFLVDTGCDIGKTDGTAFWFGQQVDEGIRMIDFLQDRHKDFSDYALMLKERGYNYRYHYLPHEAAHTRNNADSLEDIFIAALEHYGVTGEVKIVPYHKVPLGIEVVRSNFSKTYFDETACTSGIRHLENYREKTGSDGALKGVHVHDIHSHAADAYRIYHMGVGGDPLDNRHDIYGERLERQRYNAYNKRHDPFGSY